MSFYAHAHAGNASHMHGVMLLSPLNASLDRQEELTVIACTPSKDTQSVAYYNYDSDVEEASTPEARPLEVQSPPRPEVHDTPQRPAPRPAVWQHQPYQHTKNAWMQHKYFKKPMGGPRVLSPAAAAPAHA